MGYSTSEESRLQNDYGGHDTLTYFQFFNMKTKCVTIRNNVYEIFVTTNDDVTFGLGINASAPLNENQILSIWNQHYKHFFIELDVLVIEIGGKKLIK